jgi:hypothetical protein
MLKSCMNVCLANPLAGKMAGRSRLLTQKSGAEELLEHSTAALKDYALEINK